MLIPVTSEKTFTSGLICRAQQENAAANEPMARRTGNIQSIGGRVGYGGKHRASGDIIRAGEPGLTTPGRTQRVLRE